MVQPDAAGRAAENMIMAGETPPDAAPVLFDLAPAVARRDADAFEADPGAIEQPQQIMIRPEQQRDRILEGRITGEPGRIGMAVWADDGQMFDRREQLGR